MPIQVGTKVRVTGGELSGFEGRVVGEVDGSFEVEADVFGRPLRKQVAPMDLQSLDPEPDAIAALVPNLRASLKTERLAAVDALGRLGTAGSPARNDLLEVALSDASVEVRAKALWALRQGGRPWVEFVDVSEPMLRDPDDAIRREAFISLGWFGREEPERVVPLLRRLLRSDASFEVRDSAAASLGHDFGLAAADAVGELIEYIAERRAAGLPKNSHVEHLALGRMGAGGLSTLLALLRGSDLDDRRVAGRALQDIGTAAAEAIPDLLRARDEEVDESFRLMYSQTLEALGHDEEG